MSVYNFVPAPDLATKESNFATWNDGFSQEEILQIIEVGERLTPKFAAIEGNKVDEAVRKSQTSWISYNDLPWLYDKLSYIANQLNGQFFEFDLSGFVEDMQFTVYTSDNDHYEYHMDKGVSNTSPRKLSFVLQLSNPDDYEGGELQLLTGHTPFNIEKKQGFIVAFPSWVLHRVTPVTKGIRKTLVVWAAGPKFK